MTWHFGGWSATAKLRRGCALFVGVGFAFWQSQAADLPAAGAQARVLDHTWHLFQKVQDELGPNAQELADAGCRVRLGLAETRRDPLRRSEWLRAQWFYYLLNDDHARAREAIAASRAVALKSAAPPDWIATVTNELSYSLILLGQVAKAKEYLRQAIVIASQRNDPATLTDLYYSMADAYRKTGEQAVARRYFEAARELDSASADKSRQVGSELRLGSIARDAGAVDEAIQRHERAFAEFHREGNFRELLARLELAHDYAARHEFDRAQAQALLVRSDRRSLLEQRLEATTLILQVANDRREAGIAGADHVPRAPELIEDIDRMIAESTVRLGSAYSHPTRQVQFYEQAIRHYALDGDLENVSTYGRRAIRLVQHVAAGLEATHDDVLAWMSSAQPLFTEYVRALYLLDRTQLFPVLETYYSGRVAIGPPGSSEAVTRAVERGSVEVFERYQRAQQAVIAATAESQRLDAFATSAARAMKAQLRIDELLLQRDLARDAYLGTQIMLPIPDRSIGQDAAAFQVPTVPATDVVLRYFVQERVSFVVVQGNGPAEYFELPPRSQIVEMVQRARQVLGQPADSAFDRKPLSGLAKLLPPDLIARHPGASRLVIVADDAMQVVPFAAMDIGGPSRPYTPLAQRFELVRTNSAVRYYEATSHPDSSLPNRERRLVVFAHPLTGRLPGLPSALREAEAIEQLFDPRAIRAYLGADATSDALLSVDAREATVLHIATHGHFDSATPDLVALVTSRPTTREQPVADFVDMSELLTKPFASRLVVLSGCETMRGVVYRGFSGGSLADGFLSQGAGSVVGMLWKVSDEATAQLMTVFYEELSRNGGNSSLALHVAQRDLMESSRFRHPFYWAGVVLESSSYNIDQKVFSNG